MMKEFNKEILRQRITLAREGKNLNQAQLAGKSGVTPAAISQIEKGTRTPTIPVLQRIASVLNVSIDYLLGKTDESELGALLHDQDIRTFFRGFQSLNSEDKETIEKMVDFFKSKKK
ncbi:MAG: helix-turn-helix domain-containing protein [Desulfobulbaceae bacterium]|nr:helix-turn-helix domain-containing protein [Desulfobulbaceae bacterium]